MPKPHRLLLRSNDNTLNRRPGEPPEGWTTFFERHDHAQALATEIYGARQGTNAWIYRFEDVANLYRECGAPEYDERSH